LRSYISVANVSRETPPRPYVVRRFIRGERGVGATPETITDDTWPHHPDGRRLKIGEMTHKQRIAVIRGAVARMAPEFEKQGAVLSFEDDAR
jgi:hypothetical protein